MEAKLGLADAKLGPHLLPHILLACAQAWMLRPASCPPDTPMLHVPGMHACMRACMERSFVPLLLSAHAHAAPVKASGRLMPCSAIQSSSASQRAQSQYAME